MLLFSTLLDVKNIMTKENFIHLVLEWNQGSPHKENVIPDIEWNGEYSIQYGNNQLWLAINEYQSENILAVRYEKVELNGVVWDTDYIMNFNDMKMAIQLDRSYLEEALVMDPKFSTPHFITMLIEKGYLRDDGALPIERKPIFINDDNISLLIDVINGNSKYRLPVVYISKTYNDKYPVDIWKLSGRLKGVAHVLVEETKSQDRIIRQQCSDQNEYNGAIGIYFPNNSCRHKKFIYRDYIGIEKILSEKVVRNVIQYSNSQRISSLYKWQGVNNSLLRDQLDKSCAKLSVIEREKRRVEVESDELIELVDEDIKKLKKQVDDLTHANEILAYENQGLRSKLSRLDNVPILYLGEEDEFFQGEIKAILLDAIKKAIPSYEARYRRRDVLKDIVSHNDCDQIDDVRSEKLKKILKGYKSFSSQMKRELQDLGFVITDDGKHNKLLYYGDGRYMATLAKTPSDTRSGINVATEIIKTMF